MLNLRGPKRILDPVQPYAAVWEEETDLSGAPAPTAVVFLTNRECPFRCAFCDLWVNTLDTVIEDGMIPGQIRNGVARVPPARQIKLYNAGSYFDPQAVPPADDEAVAAAVAVFDRVIVEAHPAFLTGVHAERCLRFRDLLRGRLEVAVGLETAHPEVLERLNKRMTQASFMAAAQFLRGHDIDLRVFLLLSPPFLPSDHAHDWVCRSIDVAAASGATACSIIPTRGGNGALEALGSAYVPPRLSQLEAAVEYGLSLGRLRIFADLWDVERIFDCACSAARVERLQQMNRTQQPAPRVVCACDT